MVAPEDISLARWLQGSKVQPQSHTLALLEHRYSLGKKEEKPQFNWNYVYAVQEEDWKYNLNRAKERYLYFLYICICEWDWAQYL